MGVLRQLFGPSQAEVWRRLSEETGGSFVDGGFWRGSKVVVRVRGWILKVKQLLSHEPLRRMIAEQPNFHLQVKDDEGWFGADFPEGVDEVYFVAPGVIRDLDRLKSLFKIFALILHLLCHLDSAYEDDPQIRLA